MTNYEKLLNNFNILKLDKMRTYLPSFLDSLNKKEVSILDSLLELTDKEINYKNERAKENNIKLAGFPFKKELKDFNFDFQPSINKKQIQDLESLRFINDNKNILFIGASGVGKTHLATSLGMEAARKRYSVYFVSCQELMLRLNKAFNENKLESKLRHYSSYKLLIIDEIGYLPVDKQGSNIFFQLIARRYENKSTIITTNQSFSKWGEVFKDTVLANAILDRLVHHSEIVYITGKSYRLQDKLNKMEVKK